MIESGLSYPEVGATEGVLPAGYRHLRRAAVIGHGPDFFRRAGELVLGWEVQRRSGLIVRAPGPVRDGLDAELIIAVGPLRVRAPLRVVYLITEPRRIGFGYGTRIGHPERGEESFIVTLGDDDAVRMVITAFSRPASRLARLGGPLTHLVQHHYTERYLRSLAS
ncbi:DUF1990 family protein [Microlunatus speluncae]|uniref:DUF1990 family protein n=1 Tax=Microlunatus speluncae TaxID=2594267 RepID=UPI001C2D91DA|nr:DUF1990 domain-containing protein [Microlunatus speluncae]